MCGVLLSCCFSFGQHPHPAQLDSGMPAVQEADADDKKCHERSWLCNLMVGSELVFGWWFQTCFIFNPDPWGR